ncbi:CPK5, partial [Symbiodinium microadriaticum]
MLVNHDEDSPVKVIDFGMMVSLPPDGSVYKSTGAQGTRGFVAPESLRSFEYSPKSDLWQAGCTLYSLLSGLTAFSPHRLEQTLEAQYFKMEGVGWDNVSDQAKELVASILRKDPNERPTAQEILEHSWVAGGAPDTDMGAAYYKRIKNLALKQKMKTFFMDHETLLANKLQKAKLKAVLPFLRPSNRRASQNRIVLNRHMSEDSFRIPSAVDNIRLRRRSVSMDIPDLNEDVFVIPEGSSESNGSDIVDDGSSEDDFQEKMDKLSHIVMSSLSAKSIYVGTPDQMGNKDTIGNHGVTAPASPEGRVCVQDTGIDYDTFVAAMMECDLKELACPCVFNIFDIDKTGTVDLKDFLVTMVAFRDAARYSGDYADALLDRANADGSHSRDAKEAEDEDDSAARFYFNMFDVNHTGCIDQDEMKLAVSCLFADEQQKLFDADAENGHPRFQVSVPDVEALFEAIDTKKTGTIDFEEFQTFYQTVLINSTTNALG